MSSSDDSPLKPRARSESKRRYFHRGYLWPWILVLMIPFVLRFVMFYDVTFPFQSTPSATEVVRPEELQLYKLSESSPEDDVEITSVHARRYHGDRINNANDRTNHRMKNDYSHGLAENEVSTARHLPVVKRPGDQDTVNVNLEFSEDNEEDNVEGVVDEVQLRQIGDRIRAIKRWENWEERSRWNAELEVINDELEAGQGDEEKNGNEEGEELKGTQEMLASVERKPADSDEERAVQERKVAAEMEAEKDREVVEEVEATDRTRNDSREQTVAEKRKGSKNEVANEETNEERKDAGDNDEKAGEERIAAKEMDVDGEGRVSDELEAAEERRDALGWEAAKKADAEEETKLEEGKEAEGERRAAEERDAEEELMATKEREAEMKTIAAQEKEADQPRKIEDEQREAGEKESKADNSTEDKEGNESRNAVEQNQDAKQTGLEEKNSSEIEEQKTASDQNEDEGTVKLDEPTDEGNNTEDQNQDNEHKEKPEDSDQRYREDLTSHNDLTQPSLAAGECDLFDGDWEYDPEGALYTNSTCFYIRGDHNCMSNGRPDTDFLNWRWKPRGCDLPRFDSRAFMEAFRGKTIGFIGDSLARNQMQSMLCMLSLVEVPVLVHENSLITRYLYKQHQVTVAAAWSPYLLKESQEGIMGFEKGQSVLFLDVLDPAFTSTLPHCDIIVLSVGQWYFKPSVYVRQGEVIGCHYCPSLNITEIGFSRPFSEGLRLALEKVAKDWKGIAILSTFASAHGERDPAHEGEQCSRERPLDRKEWESSFRGMQNEMREIVVGEFNRMVNDKGKLNNDVHLEFLDVSTLSLLRADGHPGPYYKAHPYEGKTPDEWVFNDCLHWCLPGPVDTWNQLLVKIAHKHL